MSDDEAEDSAVERVIPYTPFPTFAEWRATTWTDPRSWNRTTKVLEDARSKYEPSDYARAREVVVRAAAVDTGAVEDLYGTTHSLTMTIATQAAQWEQQTDDHSPTMRGLFEAQLDAYQLALDIAHQDELMNESYVRQLHATLTRVQTHYRARTPAGEQDLPLPHGEYKAHPNQVRMRDGSIRHFASVLETQHEMSRLINELRSSEFQQAHPLSQAAYAHYAFVIVHPFADGNGRVARALASIFTFRAVGLPFLLFESQKNDYRAALAAADKGDVQAFQDFVTDRVDDAALVLRDALAGLVGPSPTELAQQIRDLVTLEGGLDHRGRDHLAASLANDVVEEFLRQWNATGGGSGIEPIADIVKEAWDPQMVRYAPLAERRRYARLGVRSREPSSGETWRQVHPLISRDREDEFPFLLHCRETGEELSVRLRDVHPQRTDIYRLRLEYFTKRLLAEMLQDLGPQMHASLRRNGYET